jgi:hypothetical protein
MIQDQIEQDITPFAAINERALVRGSMTPEDQAEMLRIAPIIARKNLEFLAAIFSIWIAEVSDQLILKAADGTYRYRFRDQEDAANAAEAVIRQVVDAPLAETASSLLLMAYLARFREESGIQGIEADATIHAFADLAYSYRNGTSVPLQNEAPEPFRKTAFSSEDSEILDRFCSLLHKTSGREGFFEFRPIDSSAALCSIGVIVGKRKIVLASIVGVQTSVGAEYSVRNFQQQPVPGLPPLYDSVAEALAAHKTYFVAMIHSLREEAKPWWKRLMS